MKHTQISIVEEDIANIARSINEIVKNLENETLLITGGSGFLGQYIIKTVLNLNKYHFKRPCKVISLDNYITSSKKSLVDDPNLENVSFDIIKPLVLRKNVSYIIHAAGIASPAYYKLYPLETIRVAVNGTQNLLEFARKSRVKSFLFFSSSEIYGDPTDENIPTPENYKGNVSSIGPRACYDESKRLGETLCMVYHQLYQLPVKIVRPFNIYGPGMKSNDRRVIPTFIYSGLHHNYISVFGNGRQTRAFCYISDATEAFFRVLLSKKDSEVYNVGNDKTEISMHGLAKVIRAVLRKKLRITKVKYASDYPQDEPRRRCPDIKKISQKLHYHPKINLTTGIQRTVTWCNENWIYNR